MMIDLFRKNKELILGFLIFLMCIIYICINYHEKKNFLCQSDELIVNGNVCTLAHNEEVQQYFMCTKKSLQGISVYFNENSQDGNGILKFTLYKNEVLFDETIVQTTDITTGSYYNCILDKKIDNAETDIYKLIIRNESTNIYDIPLCTSYAEDTSLKKGEETYIGQNLLMTVIYEKWNIKLLIILLMIALCIGIIITVYCMKKSLPFEKTFLILGGYIGLLYFITLPVFRAPDEINHYMRSYEISQGHFVSEHMGTDGVGGNYLPQNLVPNELCDARKINYFKVWSNRNERMTEHSLQEWTFGNTALYAPVVYLPQVLGIMIGNLFTSSSVYLVLCGRALMFIICYLMLYMTIKNTIIRKKAIFLICFMPMLMSQIVSLSADAPTIVISFSLFAYIIKLNKNEKTRMNFFHKTVIATLTLILSLCKIVYLPFCLLILLLDKHKFNSNKDNILYKVSVLMGGVLLNLIWLTVSAGFLVEFNPGVDSTEQVKYIFMHIPSYIRVCVNTFLTYSQGWMEEMIGSKLGWAMDVQIPEILIFTMLIILIIFILVSDKEESGGLQIKEKWIVGMILLITLTLIFTSLYVQWTPVANPIIHGIQGRYFLPLVPMIVCLCSSTKLKYEFDYTFLYAFVAFINMIVIIKQVFFYL